MMSSLIQTLIKELEQKPGNVLLIQGEIDTEDICNASNFIEKNIRNLKGEPVLTCQTTTLPCKAEKAASAYFAGKQILFYGFAEHYTVNNL